MNTDQINALTDDSRRLVALEAVHNFRDLGGYPTASGQTTKWQTLFRADGLYRLTPQDAQTVIDLGIKTVVDLRTTNEVNTRGTFPVKEFPVTFHHLPIIDATWNDGDTPEIEDTVEFLVWAYNEMLENAHQKFVSAIDLLGSKEVLPAVFHCAAGKDRTGVLAAFILSILGVPDEVICADYGITERGMKRLLEWAKVKQPELADAYANMPPRFAASDPRAMAVILDSLKKKYGSTQNYLREIGVSEATFTSLRKSLLRNELTN
ncbi:MAG: tyrosine-protein phosphatase [Ilumatobacteraceae bacterium]|nr:tyrosine-protein phosphatase [Ilumatobacteraceae bacterium]MBJ7421954.1 tyrosine-protein phosphatase [Ilumatobacteraceae bacterium]